MPTQNIRVSIDNERFKLDFEDLFDIAVKRKNLPFLKKIIDALPEAERLEALGNQLFFDLALDWIACSPEGLKTILSEFPYQDLPDVLVKQSLPSGRSILEYIIHQPNSLDIVLNLLPQYKLLKKLYDMYYLFGFKTEYGAAQAESFKVILDYIPKEMRLAFLLDGQAKSRLTLYGIICQPNDLKTLTESLNPEERVLLAKEMFVFMYQNIGFLQGINEKSLLVLLKLIPKTVLMSMIKTLESPFELIEKLGRKPDCLAFVLSCFSDDDRERLFHEESEYKFKAVCQAASNPQSLIMMLSLYPEKKQVALATRVIEKDWNYDFIKLINLEPECLRMILSLYPKDKLIQKVKTDKHEEIEWGLLQVVSQKQISQFDSQKYIKEDEKRHACIKVILEALPKKELLHNEVVAIVRRYYKKPEFCRYLDNLYKSILLSLIEEFKDPEKMNFTHCYSRFFRQTHFSKEIGAARDLIAYIDDPSTILNKASIPLLKKGWLGKVTTAYATIRLGQEADFRPHDLQKRFLKIASGLGRECPGSRVLNNHYVPQ